MSENYKPRNRQRREHNRVSRNRKSRNLKEKNHHRKLYLGVAGLLIVLFLTTILYKQSFGYYMLLDDQVVAQVGNKKEAKKIWDELLESQKAELGQKVVVNGEVQFKRASKKVATPISNDQLKRLLAEEVSFMTEAYTVKVDGEALFSLLDEKAVKGILEEYKKRFEPQLDEEVTLLSIDFKEEVETIKELVDIKSLDTEEEAKAKLESLKVPNTIYEIKKGDNFWDVAREHEITVTELLQLNPEAVPEKLMPGQEILIKPGQAYVTVITTLKTKAVEPIPATTRYIDDSSLLSNDRRVVEEGSAGEKEVIYKITLENGHESTMEVLGETILKEPVERVVKKGTRSFLARGVGRNYGVVSATRVTSNYGWRVHPIFKTRRFHEGVDLAAPVGRSVHAYTSGTVTFAGRTGGLGLAVYISHGNGIETRYGHLSKIDVKKGQKVSTGDRIGSVGNSGVSTGPHLHFEVRKNGKAQNPWDYI